MPPRSFTISFSLQRTTFSAIKIDRRYSVSLTGKRRYGYRVAMANRVSLAASCTESGTEMLWFRRTVMRAARSWTYGNGILYAIHTALIAFSAACCALIAEIFKIQFITGNDICQYKIRCRPVQPFSGIFRRIPFRHGISPCPAGAQDRQQKMVNCGIVLHQSQKL